jgi:hypothetical protein
MLYSLAMCATTKQLTIWNSKGKVKGNIRERLSSLNIINEAQNGAFGSMKTLED